MRRGRDSARRFPAWRRIAAMFAGFALSGTAAFGVEPEGDDDLAFGPLINWDLVALEQNGPQLNASVLTGLHSIRSPGVTPLRGIKAGVGVLYAREEQVISATQEKLSNRDQVLVTPKLNYGVWERVEIGVGATGSYAIGSELVDAGAGVSVAERRQTIDISSVDLGAKWNFFDQRRLRLGVAFDSRIAIRRGEFGQIPGSLFNMELDGDYAITSRFSLIGNLQLISGASGDVDAQVVADVAAAYSFTDGFRGLLFATVQEDDRAGTALAFFGLAGLWVAGSHAISLGLDLQLVDAPREGIRTEEQVDLALSYTYRFD